MTPRQLLETIPAQPIQGLLLKVTTANVVDLIAEDAALVDAMLLEAAASADERKLIPAYLKVHGRYQGAWLVSVQALPSDPQSNKTSRRIGNAVLGLIALIALAMALHATGVIPQ